MVATITSYIYDMIQNVWPGMKERFGMDKSVDIVRHRLVSLSRNLPHSTDDDARDNGIERLKEGIKSQLTHPIRSSSSSYLPEHVECIDTQKDSNGKSVANDRKKYDCGSSVRAL